MPCYSQSDRRWFGCQNRSKKSGEAYLTKEEMKEFFSTPHVCEYCGIPEEEWLKYHKRNLEIDRKEPGRGYVIGNIVWACHRCNTIKNNLLTYEEMKEIGDKYIRPKWETLSRIDSKRGDNGRNTV